VLYPLSYGGGNGRNDTSSGELPARVIPHRYSEPVTSIVNTPSELPECFDQRPTRVLVVDDSEVIRRLIAVNLELEGFEVFLAEDGEECLEVIETVAPDVITLDVVMPRMDGFATAARLRAGAATCSLPIVMVTACAQDSDRARGRELGVDAYLTKPFDPADLVKVVRGVSSRGGRVSPGVPLGGASGPAGPVTAP
jgi:CheY-like chemotaxis protein